MKLKYTIIIYATYILHGCVLTYNVFVLVMRIYLYYYSNIFEFEFVVYCVYIIIKSQKVSFIVRSNRIL